MDHPRIQAGVEELTRLMREHYPEATFDIYPTDDPFGVRIDVTVDVDDPETVWDVVPDRLYELQIDEELPIYIRAVHPSERLASPQPQPQAASSIAS